MYMYILAWFCGTACKVRLLDFTADKNNISKKLENNAQIENNMLYRFAIFVCMCVYNCSN